METIDILTLINTPSVGKKSVEKILLECKNYSSLNGYESLYDLLSTASKTNARIKLPTREVFYNIYNEARELIKASEDEGIHVLDVNNPNFPERLKHIPDAPIILYAKGNLKALNSEKSVAVIGTREPTDFGMKAGEKLSSIFTNKGFTIVSGLAIGCDTAGHLGCVKEHGISIGVLAGGLDKIYPKQSRELADEMLKNNGCLLSEYPIGESPRRNYFVERDRLQSGLSEAVIVIETDVKGGTMHTVGFAGKQNKLLACLGGHPDKYLTHPKIQGTKMLVNEGKAVLLSNPNEIDNFIEKIVVKIEYDFKNNFAIKKFNTDIVPHFIDKKKNNTQTSFDF